MTERQGRREHDNPTARWDVWNKWVQQFHCLYNPGPHVTVDKCLVVFRDRCPLNQHMLGKPAKYGIKIQAVCDIQSIFAGNVQLYAGKSPVETLAEELHKSKVIMLVTVGGKKTKLE